MTAKLKTYFELWYRDEGQARKRSRVKYPNTEQGRLKMREAVSKHDRKPGRVAWTFRVEADQC